MFLTIKTKPKQVKDNDDGNSVSQEDITKIDDEIIHELKFLYDDEE